MSDEKPRKVNPIFLLNDKDPSEGSAQRETLRPPVKKKAAVPSPFKKSEEPANPFKKAGVAPGFVEPAVEAEAAEEPVKPVVKAREDASVPPNPFQASKGVREPSGEVLEGVPGVDEAEEDVEVFAEPEGGAEVAFPPVMPIPDQVFTKLPVPSKRTINPMFKPAGNTKTKQTRSENKKVGLLLTGTDWEESPEEVEAGTGDKDVEVKTSYAKGFHLTERDIIMMRFLARYRYAYRDQLASLVDTTPKKIYQRLRVLKERGFIRTEPVSQRQYLYTNRKAGNQIIDIPFPEIRKGAISFATIAHTIGLAKLGVEFERESGGADLLGEGKGIVDWVQPMNRWKNGFWYNPEGQTFGEMTVTEREIRQGQTKWRGGRDVQTMRALIQEAVESGDPIELEDGQEGMFVVYGLQSEGGEHVPDLVIARERDEDGRPQHIAIELELTPKPGPEWKRILRNYRDNGIMYSKIYYFTHKSSIANSLRAADEEVGLGSRLVIRKYEPTNKNMPFWG